MHRSLMPSSQAWPSPAGSPADSQAGSQAGYEADIQMGYQGGLQPGSQVGSKDPAGSQFNLQWTLLVVKTGVSPSPAASSI